MKLDTVKAGPLKEAVGQSLYRKISRRVGEDPIETEIGRGVQGVAYELSDGSVLKVTSDVSELRAATVMMGIDHPNVVKIQDAFVVKAGKKAVGVIVRDFVRKVLDKALWADAMNSAIRNSIDSASDVYDSWRFREQKDPLFSIKKANGYLLDLLRYEVRHYPELQQVVSGIEALFAAGIYSIDYEPTNIGVDEDLHGQDQLVIFDVGNGEVEREVQVAVKANPPIEVL